MVPADSGGMTFIRTRCPTCGEVDITPDAVLLFLTPPRDRWFYAFTCPGCDREVHCPATREIVATLVAAWETTPAASRRGELQPSGDHSPDPGAPPFTLDDLIELHFLLQEDVSVVRLLHR